MKHSRLIVAAALSSALVLSGCGSSSSNNSKSKDSSTSAGSSGVTAKDVSTALAYTGGKEGKADPSKAPFTIGFVNDQGGVPSFAEQEKAVDAAAGFINDKLGGVDGHPIKLEKCFVQAEEDGQKCASQLLQAKVDIANVGVLVYGNATLYKLIGGKFPTIVSVATTGPDSTTKDVYVLNGGGVTNLNGLVDVASKKGWKKVSVISSNNPAAKYLMTNVIIPTMKKKGLSPTAVYVADTATTPDYVSALQTSGAAKSDGVYLLPATVAACVSLYDAMKQVSLTKPVVSPSQCANDPMPEKTGGGPEGWTLSGLSNPPFIASPQSNVFNHVMEAAGAGAVKNVGFTNEGFSDMLTIAKFANTIGFDNLSPEAFQKQIKGFTGTVWQGPGPIKCGVNTAQISLCGNTAALYEYAGGKWKALAPFSE